MKIKNVSCTQFAGVRDRDVSFADGINIIYGKNESGKSTLVNLISRTLFQNTKLDRRSDKEFFELYFPGLKKGSNITGDFADGKIIFETENGTYTLSKEWGTESRCMLSTPDGVIRVQKSIDDILKESLIYGEGVYKDILLSCQRNTDISLQTILDASKKTDTKQEISDAVSQAFAETDGISVDAIGYAIADKIEEIAGKHWDFDHEAPVRKSGRWVSGLGEILKAYYSVEDAKEVLEEILKLEREADCAANDYVEKDIAAQKAEEAYNKFNTYASRLAVQSERKKINERIEKDFSKISDVLSEWPRLSESLEKAKAIQIEKKNRELLDKYEAAKKIDDEIKLLNSNILNVASPADDEIAQVKAAQRNIIAFENKLCGMNLNAVFQMFGGNCVEITSLRTGELIDISGGHVSITEAVKITIPDVMEMHLSPTDVDVTSIEAQIAEQKKVISDIFAKYSVGSIEELETLAKTISDTEIKLDKANDRLALLLGEITFKELEISSKSITTVVRSKEEIEKDISAICGGMDVGTFITKGETVIGGYSTEYVSINNLKSKAFDLSEELKKAKESANYAEDIPDEYLGISDPEEHLEFLQNELKYKQNFREAALTAKTTATSKLESFKENIVGDPADELEKAERAFEEQKSLLYHWMHIAEVFKEKKDNIHDNPMQDIAEHFTYYLGIISGGKVTSEFPEADKLNINI